MPHPAASRSCLRTWTSGLHARNSHRFPRILPGKARFPRSAGFALIGLILASPFAARADQFSRTYTTDADFDLGNLQSVNHDAPNNDQLQLNQPTEPFPFLNVAASGVGTVVRIDTRTGDIIGEYKTAPSGRSRNPSRTTVDLFGNVWTGNRDESSSVGQHPNSGSVVKVGLVTGGTRVNADGTPNPTGEYLAPPYSYSTCVDRDRDGLLRTSGASGQVLSWNSSSDGNGGLDGSGDGIVEHADDECILIYQRLPGAPQVRHVSVTADNHVWVGGHPFEPKMFYLLDGDTGEVLDSFDSAAAGCGGYGGLVDGNNVLWSASIWQHSILRRDLNTGASTCVSTPKPYGLGIDSNGYIWNGMWEENTITKISPAGVVEPGFPKATGGTKARGVVATPDDHIWVANSGTHTVSRLDNSGNVVKIISVGTQPTGVALDSAGKIWVANRNSDNLMRIDPNGGSDSLGVVDLTVPLRSGSAPYNYSDMTGVVAVRNTSPQGTWTVVYDSGSLASTWGTIRWNDEPEGDIPTGASIEVHVRAADSQAALGGVAFVAVQNGVSFSQTGQFLEVRATLKPDSISRSPILSDLTIGNGCAATTTTTTTTTTTLSVCGDGTVEALEECDDGNTDPGDGCDENCVVEQCWKCVPDGRGGSFCNPDNQPCDDGEDCTINDSCVNGVCEGDGVIVPAACDWVVTGGHPTKSVKVFTKNQTQVNGDICGTSHVVGVEAQVDGDVVATEDRSKNAIRISDNVTITLDIVTGGGWVRGKPATQILPGLTVDTVEPGNILVKDSGSVYDTTGNHEEISECTIAQNSIQASKSLLDALSPTANLGNLIVPGSGAYTIGPGTTPGVTAGNLNVIDFDTLRVRPHATLTLDGGGNSDTVYILRIDKELYLRLSSVLELTGGQTAERVLFYGVGKKTCRIGDFVQGGGVVVCPDAKVQIKQQAVWQGALLSGKSKVEVGDGVQLSHLPFLGI